MKQLTTRHSDDKKSINLSIYLIQIAGQIFPIEGEIQDDMSCMYNELYVCTYMF